MRPAIFIILACGAAALAGPTAAAPRQPKARAVSLPGVRYEVLRSGPAGGGPPPPPHPPRVR
jgi:hypothetical protein